MIGTIRKHSKWLWWVIAALTIISFIGWNIAPASRNSGGGGSGGFGALYGHKVTQQDYVNARKEFYLLYWFRDHEWPDQNPNIKKQQMDQQIYLRMMLTLKASALGIHVSDQAAAEEASRMLQSLGRNGQSVPLQAFVQQVLQPENLTADDFERFARDDVAVQQLARTLGLPGVLITPQEAAAAYERDFQQASAQIVFFSASNYLSHVTVTPAAVAQFYTNYLAQYRLPDRVQVNYVEFNLSNHLAQSKAEWAKTNLEENVNAMFAQYGMDAFPKAKTADEAKAVIREDLIRRRALDDARTQANAFATKVFDMNPVRPENLATVAKQEGLTVHLTAPFGSLYGPEDFTAPGAFTKAAFGLTSDDPLAGPILGDTGVYVIALAKQLPSEIPSLDSIRDRVTQDYRMEQATMLAQRAGTNFAPALARELTTGHTFTSACLAAGLQPRTLPPFSLSTQELPELGDRADLSQVKQAVFSTPSGHATGFEETANGGFIVFVQSRLPVDQATMKADLPQFTAQLRDQRETEVFNEWIQTEANQQLRTTPVFNQQTAGGPQ
jgi:SurA-like N-terminal domain/PPIC-type PPIASE domain